MDSVPRSKPPVHLGQPPCAIPFESVPAEESAGQSQKRFMDVGPFLKADSQAAELIQPSECPFDDPSPSAQPAAMFGVALRKEGEDASVT